MKIKDILNFVIDNRHSAFFYTAKYYKKKSYLFLQPEQVVETHNVNDIEASLNRIDDMIKKGFLGYGLIPYETGYLFEKRLTKLLPKQQNNKLLQFFLFDKNNLKTYNTSDIDFSDIKTNNTEDNAIRNFRLNTSKNLYSQNVRSILNSITIGDTYQVNYTVKGKFTFTGDPVDLFINLIFNQSAEYSAFINNGEKIIISLSPELFFHLNHGELITKPMKGTISRGINLQDDKAKRKMLKMSSKDNAENIMIVDLLRNDMGKICEFGSVKVDELFNIEKYETLFQMTSRIRGRIRENICLSDIIKNLFPCGSVTGAPKIKTMEIINKLEKEQRGIYTGMIGLVTKSNTVFNVAIRTIVLDNSTKKGEIGLGSGIVADSNPQNEYDELLLKGNFLTKPQKQFELFETILIENGKPFLITDHLNRLQSSASYFLFVFEKRKIINEINSQIKDLSVQKNYRLKIILNKWGNYRIEISELNYIKDNFKIIISSAKVSSQNRFQYFKTTNRLLYEQESLHHSPNGFDEVLFLNEKNELTEGTRTNVFLRKKNKWFTPSINCGLLPGVYRNNLIKKRKDIKETILKLDDIISADEIFLTNSLRKEIKVNSVYFNPTDYKRFI